MPTLVVEDGSGVTDANTYIDEAYLTSYASDRGFSIPSLTADRQTYLLQAMDYLAWFVEGYQGTKTVATNSLPWPRQDVTIDSVVVVKTTIPEQLKKAQAQLVVELQKRTKLFPSANSITTEGYVTEETIGPLTTKYSATGKGSSSQFAPIQIVSVQVFLKQLLKKNTGVLTTYRA